MKFKLPTDKKERTKVLVLILIGAAAVVYVAYNFGIKRFTAQLSGLEAAIRVEQESLEKTVREIRQTDRDRSDIIAALKELAENDRHVLKLRHESYAFDARERIEAQASGLGLALVRPLNQVGPTDIPSPSSGPNQNSVRAYTAGADFRCGMHDFVKLLRMIEPLNPFACVVVLRVRPHAETPDRHQVYFEVQWPIWAKPEMAETCAKRLEELQKDAAGSGQTGRPEEKPQ